MILKKYVYNYMRMIENYVYNLKKYIIIEFNIINN